MPTLTDWLNLVLPNGKGELLMYGLYADESSADRDGYFVVAGYLIASKKLPGFVQAWGEALGPLEYFHMREGHHKKHPEIYQRLLRLLTTDHLLAAFHASVRQDEYRRVMGERYHGHPMKYWFGGHYSFCVSAIADLANRWMDRNNPGERDMAYVFEAGHERQGEADVHLQQIASDPFLQDRKKKIRYYSHAFVDGKRKEAAALQAADLYSWHIVQALTGNWQPKDNTKLVSEIPRFSVHYPETGLKENLRENVDFNQIYGQLKSAPKIGRRAR